MRDSCREDVASDLDVYKDRFEFLGLEERIGPGGRGTQASQDDNVASWAQDPIFPVPQEGPGGSGGALQ